MPGDINARYSKLCNAWCRTNSTALCAKCNEGFRNDTCRVVARENVGKTVGELAKWMRKKTQYVALK
jgi:hypothetical protein